MNQINLNKAIGAFFASTAAGAKSAPALRLVPARGQLSTVFVDNSPGDTLTTGWLAAEGQGGGRHRPR